ncbi:unnamed protein product [Rotaria magnacalcarata]|uniref:Uncharacterized protein n=2 Tax=Rotaria magnacalcarata TaxID=392030 RepID=A0A817A2X5_9BILA|nr:unnamed protein product [Rotaria magnacalcarata]CAF1577533.1 unnamed protein product [Rotaria magnacalcarata]CAF2055652.1 unnamed protein product [Rotaria magnacalcarata]CAF2227688.1 unnamed protein product [Rotaria magnacalcarata]CAF4119549.1 unnamed protein product [Rotaria magnacalcarata]
MSAGESRGRGRGKRTNRASIGPPEPYRSQSMAIILDKFHQGNKEKRMTNRPPSASTTASSGRKLSSDHAKSTSRSSASRAKSTRALRTSIRSAVPDTSIITLAERPDQGGTAGQKLRLYTNHFKCNIPQTLKCHQYDIELETANRDGTWRPARKDDRFLVLRKIIERENFPFVWYDEGKSLYSIELLVGLKDQYEIIIKERKTDREQQYRLLLINLVKSYDIQVLWDFIENRIAIRPRDPIRILETLLKQTTRASMVCVKNQFYDRRQQLDDLGDGRGLGRGFYQAMFLTKIGATLNINSTFTCFYQPFNLVHFLCEYLQHDIVRDGINEREQQLLLRKVLKPIWLETHHTETVRKYRIRGFGASARQHTFPRTTEMNNEDNQERQSVFEYFLEKYNITLQYPNLPTVELYSPPNKTQFHYLPMECCTVQAWQRSMKPLTADQRARVTRKTVVNPNQRYQAIMDIVRVRNFNEDKYVTEIGMSVDDQQMITVPARFIAPPEIKYKSGRDGQSQIVERINIGKWNLRNRFQKTKTIDKWACVLISTQRPNNNQLSIAKQFVDQFPQIIAQYGICFQSSPMMFSDPTDPQVIHDRLRELKESNCEVVVFILNGVGEETYKSIKYFGNQKLGIVTQCTDFVAIAKNIKNRKLDMYLQNLVQKFNAKLGGVNGVVSIARALTSSSTKDDVFMFFGADVTHTTCSRDKPSIAAVIGSVDTTSTQYASRVSEQYPARGKISLEIIKDLYLMSTDLLKLFAQRNGCFPNKIVFYRDGVDDGHFQKVLDHEIRSLQNACKALYMNNPLPKITFIIVKKRHNTRFFVRDPATGNMSNVQPGTVIDTDIVHPLGFDFYLNSHAAIQGTSRPILYHVLYDEIGFSSDEIQSLTYFLCHSDVRCTKAVSIPAPVHYAHLAAYQSRDADSYENDRRSTIGGDFDDDDLGENMGSITLQDVETRLIQLDPTIQDTMWYV